MADENAPLAKVKLLREQRQAAETESKKHQEVIEAINKQTAAMKELIDLLKTEKRV